MITSLCDRIGLNDGNTIPGIGAGVFQVAPGEETYNSVRYALDAGFRYIDTAAYYGNEEDVGKAVRDSGLPREDVFIATKIWIMDFSDPDAAIADSLNKLGLGYIDLNLLHWPGLDESLRLRAWEALLGAKEKGTVRSVGVSNFYADQMEAFIQKTGVAPVNNQVELHPWHQQKELREYCEAKDITVTAWSPLFRGKFLEDQLIKELAEKYNKTEAQIVIRWHIQNNIIVIPRSVRKDRVVENTKVFDFEILPEDIERMDALDGTDALGPDPREFDGIL